MPEHGYTISSPCEPEGSGELIIVLQRQNIVLQRQMTPKQNLMTTEKFSCTLDTAFLPLSTKLSC